MAARAASIETYEEATAVAPTRDAILARLRAAEPALRAEGIVGLALFGSVARDEATAASDVDLVLDSAPGRRWSLIDLSGLRLTLVDLLDRDVGVVVREDLRPTFLARIEPDLIRVY